MFEIVIAGSGSRLLVVDAKSKAEGVATDNGRSEIGKRQQQASAAAHNQF